jgi:hypothetical protein
MLGYGKMSDVVAVSISYSGNNNPTMTTKLRQKKLFKGTQEFEIIDDVVKVHIKTWFDEESLSVMLTVLNPEPVIEKSRLHFNSRVNGEPLISLYLAKPNVKEFNAFVAALTQQAQEKYNAFTGVHPAIQAASLGDNVYDEPPEFSDFDQAQMRNSELDVDIVKIDRAIKMLGQYFDAAEVSALISALQTLREEPQNEAHLVQVAKVFHALGPKQGAVLTYAPYVSILLSDDPFGGY